MNKVKYGLKNAHYAVRTNTAGVITYGTPVLIPGAVGITLTPKGEKAEFYADDNLYFSASSNQGYEGSLEVALLPDTFKTSVMGWKTDADGVLYEDANAIFKDVAILFEFSGDANAIRHCLFNVAVSRPNIESGTKNATIDVKTETVDITASPNSNGIVKAKAEPTSATYATWFTEVPEYVAVV